MYTYRVYITDVVGTCHAVLVFIVASKNTNSVLSPLFRIGTMIDSFHSSGNSSLFQMEIISL